MYYIYILRCHDQSLYIGITTDLKRRFHEHINKKGAKYTRVHTPLFIEASWSCADRSLASKLEYRLKKLSKKEKENLIHDFEYDIQPLLDIDKKCYERLNKDEMKVII